MTLKWTTDYIDFVMNAKMKKMFQTWILSIWEIYMSCCMAEIQTRNILQILDLEGYLWMSMINTFCSHNDIHIGWIDCSHNDINIIYDHAYIKVQWNRFSWILNHSDKYERWCIHRWNTPHYHSYDPIHVHFLCIDIT